MAAALIDACAKHGDIKAAEEIFVSVVPNGETFNNLTDGCAKHGVVGRTEEAMRTVGVRGIMVDTRTKRGEIERNEEIFETMRTAGVVPNVPDAVTFINLNIYMAEEIFEKMKSHAIWSKLPWMNFPDMVKFNSLDIKNDEKVFVKIKASREQRAVVPDGLTFNNLGVKRAEEVFEKRKSACELPNVVKINKLDVQKNRGDLREDQVGG
jgi:pentatricopeptide repeat protein